MSSYFPCYKLKACFLTDILGSAHFPVESVNNYSVWYDSDFFPCPNMFRMSEKVVLCYSVTLDMPYS